MPHFETRRVVLPKPRRVMSLIVALPFFLGGAPTQAQDIFGFFRPVSAPVTFAPAYQPFEFRAVPALENFRPRPRVRPRPKPAALEESEVKKPEKPRSPGDATNPVPELLTDSTLRAGDMVMFPDGLPVFTGRPGDQHRLADFKPVSQAGKAVASSARKLVAGIRPGMNTAWSADAIGAGGKLATISKDVETTGSVKRKIR